MSTIETKQMINYENDSAETSLPHIKNYPNPKPHFMITVLSSAVLIFCLLWKHNTDIVHNAQPLESTPLLSWLTLLFLVDARGSVIHAPNRVPDVFIVTGPVIFINFPHAVNKEMQR